MEIVPITYKIKFIDSAGSMASSLWSVTNNHVDGYKVCVAGTKSQIHESQVWFTSIQVSQLQQILWKWVWQGFIKKNWKDIHILWRRNW